MDKRALFVIPVIIMLTLAGCTGPQAERSTPSSADTIPAAEEGETSTLGSETTDTPSLTPPSETHITFFAEDFENGLENWILFDKAGVPIPEGEGWYLERIDSNTILRGEGHNWARLRIGNWDNYTFKTRFKIVQGTIHFNYRYTDTARYIIGVSSHTLYLKKQNGDNFYDLAQTSSGLDEMWHETEIRGYSNSINIFIDGNLVITYMDNNPLLNGTIAFEVTGDGEFLIDKVEVSQSSPDDILTVIDPQKVRNASKSGRLTTDEIWSGEIQIVDHILVPNGVTLTIEPGTVVKFKHYRGYKEPDKRLSLVISGILKAVGTPEEQIWFTSDAEDPCNGDWHMLRFINAGSDSIIKYGIVEFAQQGINIWNSSPTISHSIVRWNNWEGIYLESYCGAAIENCLIYENGYNGVAMEQFNHVIMKFNTVSQSGTNGIHVDASMARLEFNIVKSNIANGLSVDDHGTIIAINNTIEDNGDAGIGLGEGSNKVTAKGNKFKNNSRDIDTPQAGTVVENNLGDGAGDLEYDYPDSRHHELGYIPGDPEIDRYMYICPDEDETRKVVKKIGEGLGLTWSVTWDGEYIWTATLQGDVYKLDTKNGKIITHWKFPGPQAWGMTYDGTYLWINDFAEKKVYELDTAGNVISTFVIPDQTGGAKGITWDGENLYLMGWTSPTIYKLDRAGNLLERIQISGGHAGGGLAWDSEYFWAPGGRGICRIDRGGKIVGSIYPASEGTWDLTWDGQHLWATQRTNENWQDAKIYSIEILDNLPE